MGLWPIKTEAKHIQKTGNCASGTHRPACARNFIARASGISARVWLTGAGPGDPGLMTLHAVNALQQADCVVYDALVSENILSLTRTEAELIYRKRGGKPSLRQEDISRQLVSLALKKRVLRLRAVIRLFSDAAARSPGWCRRNSVSPYSRHFGWYWRVGLCGHSGYPPRSTMP